MDLPNRSESAKTGKSGLTILTSIVENKLGWLLRPTHQEEDFGIDAYIDIVTKQGQVTGKSIAVQVKSGQSYFKEKSKFGWIYYGEIRHLNYYLNNEIPIIIVLVNIEKKKAFWALCDPAQTEKHGNRWSITIPFNQPLDSKSKNELIKYVGQTIDYVSQLEQYWGKVKFLKSAQLMFVVGKKEILNQDYSPLVGAFNKLAQNKELLYTHQEKIDIWIHGYDNDPRELFEIEEVRDWIGKAVNEIPGLAFFLMNKEYAVFLKLVVYSKVKINIIKGSEHYINGILRRKIDYKISDTSKVLNELFQNLNAFCAQNKIPIKLIEEISNNITDFISGGEFKKAKNKA
jgi:hypothetical protein